MRVTFWRVLRLYLNRAAEAIPGVVNQLQQVRLDPISLTLTQPTLDDVFLTLTGRRAEQTDDEADEGHDRTEREAAS